VLGIVWDAITFIRVAGGSVNETAVTLTRTFEGSATEEKGWVDP
jgi:hypothetical protein